MKSKYTRPKFKIGEIVETPIMFDTYKVEVIGWDAAKKLYQLGWPHRSGTGSFWASERQIRKP